MASKVAKDQLELHLKHVFEHGVNFSKRIIRLNQDITDESFDLVDSAMTEMESHNGKPITIRICSEGGDAYHALAIVGRMRRSNCRVITEGYGQVMSAATLIFVAGDVRRISKYTSFMWHESSYDLSGRHQENKKTIEQMEHQENLWAEWMAEHSNKPKGFYYEAGKSTDKYWTPETLIEYGIADEII